MTTQAENPTYVVSPDGCWHSTAAVDECGYSRIAVNRRSTGAHRVAYELWVGPIPEGMQVDHVCHNTDPHCLGGVTCPHRRCINPDHLEIATPTVNTLNGKGFAARYARRSACKRGHEYTEQNTRWIVGPNGTRKWRRCKACLAEYQRTGRARRRLSAEAA